MKPDHKEFDCVQNMRRIRSKISEEIENMTPDELIRYFRSLKYSNPYLQQLADRAKKQKKDAA